MSELDIDRFSTSITGQEIGPHTHTQTPVTTGTSVLGLRYTGGVVLAADTLGSYGSLARYRNCPRLLRVNNEVVVGCTGDHADFQYLSDLITSIAITDECIDDGNQLNGKSLHSWLTRVLYNKRSSFDPLWTNFVVAGGGKEPFLGYVDMNGTSYQDGVIATGYGAYIATPLLRAATQLGPLNEEQAKAKVVEALRVLYYRDARAHKNYNIAVINAEGGKIEGPFAIEDNWDVAHFIQGY